MRGISFLASSFTRQKDAVILAALAGVVSAILASGVPIKYLLVAPIIFVGAILLLKFPEVALALFLVIGAFKGNPTIRGFFGPLDPTLLLAAILWISIGVRLWKQDRFPIHISLIVPLGLFVIIMLAGLIDASIWSVGIDKAARFLALTMVGMLSPIFILREKTAWRRFLIMLAIIAAVVSERIVGAWLGNSTHVIKVVGTNHLALARMVGVGVIIASYIYLMAESLQKKLLALVLTMLGVIVLFLSGGRGSALALTVTFILAGAIILVNRETRNLMRSSVLGISAGLVLAALFAWAMVPSVLQERLVQALLPFLTGGAAVASVGARLELFSSAASMIMRFPVFGIGFGEFPGAFGTRHFFTPLVYPHNILLEIGAEMGLVGLGAFLVLVFFAVRVLIKTTFLPGSSIFSKSSALLGLMLLVNAFGNALGSGDINDNKFLWFTIGLAYATASLFGERSPAALARTEGTIW